MKLSSDEIVFDPASVADPNGRVFWWGGNVYRGIREKPAGLYRTLLESEAFARLIDAGMIGTQTTELSLDGFDLVLSHDTIRFRSYPFEWCDQMLKDAALLTCDINLALASVGLATQDAHPWNVLFDGPFPKWIDFGSIVPRERASGSWRGCYREFEQWFLYPLHLMSAGRGHLARHLLEESTGLFSREQAAKQLPVTTRIRCRAEALRHDPARFRSGASFLERLREFVEDIPLPEAVPGWSRGDETDPPSPAIPGEQCHQGSLGSWIATELLSKLRPSPVVQLTCTRGRAFLLAAAPMDIPIAALDSDETRVRSVYADAAEAKHRVLPLVIDVHAPTASDISVRSGSFRPAATERLKGELAVGLGVVDDLVFGQGFDLDDVVEKLSAFTGKWLLVDSALYSREKVAAVLGRYFVRAGWLESSPAPGRLVLCER